MALSLTKKLENNTSNKNSLRFFKEFFVLFLLPFISFSQWNPSNPTIPAPGDCISSYRICDATQTYNFELLNAGVIDDANGSLGIPGLNKSTPTSFESKSCFIEFTPQYSGQFGLSVCPESTEDLTLILFHNPNCSDLQTGNYSLATFGGTFQTPDACKGLGLNPNTGNAESYVPFVNIIAGDSYKLFVSVDWYTQPGTHKFTLSFQGTAVTTHPDLFSYPNCNLSNETPTIVENYVSVFPNPFTDVITITSPLVFEKLAMYDVLGKLVHEQNYQTQIQVKNLSKGIYFLHLIDAEGKKVIKKVVKE